jgi:hypothetical protein
MRNTKKISPLSHKIKYCIFLKTGLHYSRRGITVLLEFVSLNYFKGRKKSCLLGAEQSRAEQSRAEQSRAEQSRAEQSRESFRG